MTISFLLLDLDTCIIACSLGRGKVECNCSLFHQQLVLATEYPESCVATYLTDRCDFICQDYTCSKSALRNFQRSRGLSTRT